METGMNAKVKITNRAGASFPVRQMNFEFEKVPAYWMSGSAGLTHFMTALSALCPTCERFFSESVRAVRQHPPFNDNAAVKNAISAFIGQEARHTQVYLGFHASAQRYGHDVDALDHQTDRVIQAVHNFFA